jgi:hypothetical protein
LCNFTIQIGSGEKYMIRTKKKAKEPHRPEAVTNREPLVQGAPADHPHFVAALKGGAFEAEDLVNGRMKFKNDFSRQVYYLMRLGARQQDVAEFFGVSTSTVAIWAERNEDFKQAAREGAIMFGMKVAETLGQRALGYDYTETEMAEHLDKYGRVHKLMKVTNRHMPPDVTAIIFYLKNRHRDAWADVNRVEVDASVEITQTLNMERLTEAEREMVRSIAIKNVSTLHGVTNN